MISSLLHLVGLRPRVYYTLTNFRGGGGQGPLGPPPSIRQWSMSQLHRLGSFDHASMSTCVAQSAKRRTSDLDITGSSPQATIRHNTFE